MNRAIASREAALLALTGNTATPGGTASKPLSGQPQRLQDGHGSVAGDGLKHLNQTELSRRWNLSPRTLERWRWMKTGPLFLKIGGRVVYAVADIIAYETANQHGQDWSR